jgi:predicted esterase
VNPNRLRRANVSLQQGLALMTCLLFSLGVGCRRAPSQASNERAVPVLPAATAAAAPSVPAAAVPTAPSAATSNALPPLSANWLEPLPLADGDLAYVTPPVGAREPRPLMVAVHGAGDRPDWACGGWRLGANEYPFVVCPQGLKFDSQRFAWDSPSTIARRVQAAIDAVRARFGPYIADGPTIYAGFSQGATMAGTALLEQRDRFPVVALAEGGYNLLRDQAFLQKLRSAGTTRLMIVCGSPACFATAHSVQGGLERAGIEAFTAGDAQSGHNLNERMQIALRAALPQLTSGLPNWRDYPRYLAARATNTPASRN